MKSLDYFPCLTYFDCVTVIVHIFPAQMAMLTWFLRFRQIKSRHFFFNSVNEINKTIDNRNETQYERKKMFNCTPTIQSIDKANSRVIHITMISKLKSKYRTDIKNNCRITVQYFVIETFDNDDVLLIKHESTSLYWNLLQSSLPNIYIHPFSTCQE